MSPIHYSFMPLILFLVPYMLDLLLQYLSFVNSVGGVDKFSTSCISMFCREAIDLCSQSLPTVIASWYNTNVSKIYPYQDTSGA